MPRLESRSVSVIQAEADFVRRPFNFRLLAMAITHPAMPDKM